MKAILLTLLALIAAFAADDPWAKLREVKSGNEIKVWKKGATQPVLAKFDDLTEEHLLVVLKDKQSAIPRDEIDRVDARPSQKRTITKETKVSNDVTNPQAPKPPSPYNSNPAGGPSGSMSSGLNIGGKPDFENVYRRSAGAPSKP